MYELDEIQIFSKYNEYQVSFQELKLEHLMMQEDRFIILDANLARLLNAKRSTTLIEVKPGETSKEYSEVSKILSELALKGLNRSHTLVVVGGGSIQDVGTFVASLYMRGLDWVYYPTTLQSMADSCVGGKSAINLGEHKNLIGNFYPPRSIVIDTTLTSSLSKYDLACGLIEGLKIAFASGIQPILEFVKLIEQHLMTDAPNPELMEQIVHLSLSCKKKFVEEDEFDHGIRKLLNFGHTYGHAIEASTSFEVHHGIAVGIGILASFEHRSNLALNENEELLVAITRRILEPFAKDIRQQISEMNYEAFSQSIQMDKKRSLGELTFIHSINGDLQRVLMPNDDSTRRNAYRSIERAVNAI